MFDFKTKRHSKQNVKTVAFANNLYTLHGHGDPGALEAFFSRLEAQVAPVVRDIVAQGSIGALTNDDRLAFGVFTGFQLLRVYGVRAYFEAYKGRQTSFAITAEGARAAVTQGPDDPHTAHLALMDAAKVEVASRVLAMTKRILIASGRARFCISDNPVVVYSSVSAAAVGSTLEYVMRTFTTDGVLDLRKHLLDRLDQPGVEFYFPLSSNVCLFLCAARTAAIVAPTDVSLSLVDDEVRTLNLLQMLNTRRFLYAGTDDVFDEALHLMEALLGGTADELLYDMLWNRHFVVSRTVGSGTGEPV
jgi:hypothetical protein